MIMFMRTRQATCNQTRAQQEDVSADRGRNAKGKRNEDKGNHRGNKIWEHGGIARIDRSAWKARAYILVMFGVRPFPDLILLLKVDLLRHGVVVEQARVYNAPLQIAGRQLIRFKQHMHRAQRVDKVLVRPLVRMVVHTDVLRKNFHIVVEMILWHPRQPTPQQAH